MTRNNGPIRPKDPLLKLVAPRLLWVQMATSRLQDPILPSVLDSHSGHILPWIGPQCLPCKVATRLQWVLMDMVLMDTVPMGMARVDMVQMVSVRTVTDLRLKHGVRPDRECQCAKTLAIA